MRAVPDTLTAAWLSGSFVGPQRPMARVTIQRTSIQLTNLDSTRLFASALFGQNDVPRELPNVKSLSWNRGVGTDVATAKIELYNTAPLPLGSTPVISGDFGLPGYYTPGRGASTWSARWGHTSNAWQDWLVPDRIVRTFEGYGFDRTVAPEKDPYLVPTGVWLIDDVDFTSGATITLTCRDLGRMLLDSIMFPPVVPLAAYPLAFTAYHEVANPDIITTSGSTFRPTYATDSGVPYVGHDGAVLGHYPHQAFDGSTSTYWLSIGNALPSAGYSFEYVQGNCAGRTVSSVTFTVYGGPYRVYVSVMQGGVWRGNLTVPYDPHNPASAPNGANIKFVNSKTVDREGSATFAFATPYTNVQAVRLSFTNLYNSRQGALPYRAGVRDFVCSSAHSTTTDGGTHTEGNYGDYSEVVKLLLAYGGFYWPKNPELATRALSDGSVETDVPTTDDPYLTSGRVWGDIQMSGTAGIVPLNVTIWDKKPLMDGISYVRDILGFIFYVDETGGAVFRMPNIWKAGNVIGDNAGNAGFTPDILTIDERQTLLSLRAKLSSRNIRENVFVADVGGSVGAVAAGYNPVHPDPGLRRVGGWTDQHFASTTECQKTADLIVVRQMFEYRSDQIKISANPAIQIDDQVRIYERVTSEGYLHYVKSISSSNDLESGVWTYDLEVHWLGDSPDTEWAFNPAHLSAATQLYLQALGQVSGVV